MFMWNVKKGKLPELGEHKIWTHKNLGALITYWQN